jgi:hypothetical protein
MTPSSTNPRHQPETEYNGEIQVFSGVALRPDDPRLEPRERKGRPADADSHSSTEKRHTQEKD